jgi:hypothetical protein
MIKCEKCGSKVFLVDETVTHLEINEEIILSADKNFFSDAFEGERFRDRNKIRRIKLEISCDLEPLPYRPQDFTADDPFVKKIIETGMRVV